MTGITTSLTPEQYLSVLASAGEATAIYTSEELHIGFINDAMLHVWGKDRGITGKTLEQALPELAWQPFIALLKNVWHTGETYRATGMPAALEINGELITSYFDFEYRAVKDAEGKTYCLLHTATDVSAQLLAKRLDLEKKEREHALNTELNATNKELRVLNSNYDEINKDLKNGIADTEAALAQLSLAQKATGFGIFDLDVPTNRLYWDERCRKIFGIGPDKEVTYGNDFTDGLHPEDRERTLKAVTDAYNKALTGGIYDIEYRVVDATSGEVCWVRAVGQVYFDEQENPLRFIGTVVDIGEAVEARNKLQDFNEELTTLNEELAAVNEEYQAANDELQETNGELKLVQLERDTLYDELAIREERLRFAMGAADIGTWDLDIRNSLVTWDDRCKELYGFSKEDIVPYEQVLRYMHPDDMPRVNEAVQYALDPASRGSYDIRFRTIGAEDGRLRWLHCCGKAFFDEAGNPYRFSGIASDITAEKDQADALELAHQKVKEKEEQLTSAKEAAQLGLFDWDLVTKTYSWDTGFRQMYNLPLDVTFSDNQAVLEKVHPDDRDRINKQVRQSQTFGVNNGRYDIEYRITATPDQPLKWVRAIGKTLFDEQGTPLRFIGSVMDITEQKQEEQRKQDFIGIVSHELRSPLTSLKAYVQILDIKAKKASDETIQDLTAKAKRQVDKMTGMISGFLDVARVGEGKIQLDLKAFDMADLVKLAEAESLATITTHPVIFHPVEYTPVLADQDKIEQVIVNLVNNAVKYSPPGSIINVACITVNGFARVSVTDEGLGIPLKDQPYVFDRFYRVESEISNTVKGFGIGLYLCRDIIHQHKGEIGLISTPGQGSTFWFRLPVNINPVNEN